MEHMTLISSHIHVPTHANPHQCLTQVLWNMTGISQETWKLRKKQCIILFSKHNKKRHLYNSRYKCKYGRQLVSKKAFEAGVSNTFLDEIMSSCQVYGALNSTIGSYTCTRGCEAPTNYSEVFIWDWEESKGSDIGSKVK